VADCFFICCCCDCCDPVGVVVVVMAVAEVMSLSSFFVFGLAAFDRRVSFFFDCDGPEGRISTSLFPSSSSESTVSSCLVGSFLTLERLAGEEGAVVNTDVPVSCSCSCFLSSAGDDDSRFLLPLPAAAVAAAGGVSRDALFCCCCAALAWRENIASMPSLRFLTGSMNVGDWTPTLPTSLGTA